MSKGLQDYQRTIQGLQSSKDSVQSYIDNYDADFFQNWRDNLPGPAKDVVGGIGKVVDEFDSAYLGGKILHATYKGLKKKLTKKGDDPGDEEGKDEKTEDNTPEEEENPAPDVEDTPEGSSGAVNTENVSAPKESVANAEPDEPSAEVGGEPDSTEATLDSTPEEDTRLFDNLKNAPEPTKENFGLGESSDPAGADSYSLVAPEDLSSSDAVLGGADNVYTGSVKGFNSDFAQPDEFDLPSGLGDTSLFGQGETTATRLANNNLIGGGGRAGPEILGQQTGGGFGPLEDPTAIPKIQTQGLSSQQEALQLFPKDRPPAQQETIPTDDSPIFPGGTQQGPDTSTGTQGQAQVKSNTGEADGDIVDQSDRLKSLASGDDVSPSSLLEQGKSALQTGGKLASDDAGGFLSGVSDAVSGGLDAIGTGVDAALGTIGAVADTLGPVGLVAGLGIGLYEAFKPKPKPKKPPPTPQLTTFAGKGEMVLPSYDSVVDAPASSTAF